MQPLIDTYLTENGATETVVIVVIATIIITQNTPSVTAKTVSTDRGEKERKRKETDRPKYSGPQINSK